MNRRTVLVFLVLALLTAALAISNLNQQPVPQVPVSEPAATEVLPAATAVPDEPVIPVLPTVAYSEPTEVPTAAAPEVLEYSSALDLMWNTCKKFSGGGPTFQWADEYIPPILLEVGLDPYPSQAPWWHGLVWYETATGSGWRALGLDPNAEYCFFVLVSDDVVLSESLNYLAPLGTGLVVYENQDGEFVVLKVYYNVSDRDMK
ncbi:MAG: hypothetical protein WED08_02680 [Patescibacteria group bacterium]